MKKPQERLRVCLITIDALPRFHLLWARLPALKEQRGVLVRCSDCSVGFHKATVKIEGPLFAAIAVMEERVKIEIMQHIRRLQWVGKVETGEILLCTLVRPRRRR